MNGLNSTQNLPILGSLKMNKIHFEPRKNSSVDLCYQGPDHLTRPPLGCVKTI